MKLKDNLLKGLSILFPNIYFKKKTSVYTGITDEDLDMMFKEENKKCNIRNIHGDKVSRVTKKYTLKNPYSQYELVSVTKTDNGIFYTLMLVFDSSVITVTKEDFKKYFEPGE